MRIADFALERYFARWEFSVRHVLGASDVEGLRLADLLSLADDESLALWQGLRLGYTESLGHPLLRAEIASLYDTIEPDEVLVFAGAEEAIFCLANTALAPGDHAIVTWPGYQSLYEVARAAGADVAIHRLRADEDWALDVPRIRASLRPDTRAVVVNAPHNPTGMLPGRAEWASLVEACADAGIRLVGDEVYRFLERDPASRLAAAADAAPLGVSIGVMSKSFALAGLRIGWLATHDRELLARCAAFKDYTTICSSAASEILAIIGLRARDTILARSRAIVEANLAFVDDFFLAWAGTFDWVRPRGGTVGFPRLLAPSTIEVFAADLVREAGVLLVPGSVFDHPGNHFRLGLGRQDLPEAMRLLDGFARRSFPDRAPTSTGALGR